MHRIDLGRRRDSEKSLRHATRASAGGRAEAELPGRLPSCCRDVTVTRPRPAGGDAATRVAAGVRTRPGRRAGPRGRRGSTGGPPPAPPPTCIAADGGPQGPAIADDDDHLGTVGARDQRRVRGAANLEAHVPLPEHRPGRSTDPDTGATITWFPRSVGSTSAPGAPSRRSSTGPIVGSPASPATTRTPAPSSRHRSVSSKPPSRCVGGRALRRAIAGAPGHGRAAMPSARRACWGASFSAISAFTGQMAKPRRSAI